MYINIILSVCLFICVNSSIFLSVCLSTYMYLPVSPWSLPLAGEPDESIKTSERAVNCTIAAKPRYRYISPHPYPPPLFPHPFLLPPLLFLSSFLPSLPASLPAPYSFHFSPFLPFSPSLLLQLNSFKSNSLLSCLRAPKA